MLDAATREPPAQTATAGAELAGAAPINLSFSPALSTLAVEEVDEVEEGAPAPLGKQGPAAADPLESF